MLVYIDLILAMGFAWMISGISLLWVNRKRNNVSVRSSILLILTFGLTLLDNLIKPEMLPETLTMIIFAVSRNSYFLIGPFLLFYTQSLLSSKIFRYKDLFHFLPFLIFLISVIYNTEVLFPSDTHPPIRFFDLNALIDPEFYRNIFSIISRGVYCFFIFKLIRTHLKNVPEYYSYKTSNNTLSWLYYLIIIYLALFASNFLLILFSHGEGFLFSFLINTGRLAPSLLFIFFFALFAQNQPVLEDKQISEITFEPKIESPQISYNEIKYKTSGMGELDSSSLYESLNLFLLESRLFTDPDLTLNSLAQSMGETRHRISEVINKKSGDNFYAFINGFRFREFINCIKEVRYPNYTITAIALECGFKSNSVFYSVFRKNSGMTPKEYIKHLNYNKPAV